MVSKSCGRIGTRGSRRMITLVLLFVYIAGSGSAIWSWQCLKPLMLQQRAFEYVCQQQGTALVPVDDAGEISAKCHHQDTALTDAWKWGTSFSMIISVCIAPLYDLMGSKRCGACGQLLFILGLLFLAFAKSTWSPYFYYIGFTALGMAQIPTFNACLSLVNWYPKSPNLIIAVLSSAGDLSYNVPVIISFISTRIVRTTSWSDEMSTRGAFLIYAICICGSLLVIGIVLLPWKEFKTSDSSTLSADFESNSTHETLSWKNIWDKYLIPQEFCTTLLFLQMIYFAIGFLRLTYVSATVDSIVGEMPHKKHQADMLLNSFRVIQRFGVIFSLAIGYFADRTNLSNTIAAHNTFAFISSVGMCCIPYIWFQPISFIAFEFFASFLFSQAFCWIHTTCGFSRVNTLMALVTCPAALSELILTKVLDKLDISQRSHNLWHNYFFLLVSPVLYVIPYVLKRHQTATKYHRLPQTDE